MSQETIVDLFRDSLYTIMLASAPPLLLGLIVGVLVSIFQTVTSIQEPTLAFIPKILAVLLSLIIFGPFIMTTLSEFTMNILNNIPSYVGPPR